MNISNYGKIEIRAMQTIGKADMVAARLLWNLGLTGQSIWMLQQSMEKYLKCLWSLDNPNVSGEELRKKLRHGFSHGIFEIIDSLTPERKKELNTPLWLVEINNLRYEASFFYSYRMFRSGEVFINKIRRLLGENVKKNHLEEWEKAPARMRLPKKQEELAKSAVKKILSLTNPVTKKERIEHKRLFDKIVSSIK